MKDPREQLRRDRDPDTQPIPAVRSAERQRAAIALGVLAIVALVVVGIMVAVLGSNGGGTPSSTPNANRTGPNVVATGGNGGGHPSGKQSGSPTKAHHGSRPPKQPSSSPRNGPVSCPTSAPCDLPDDVGNVVQAINSFRASHGKPPVQGKVTQAARTCAVSSGNTCPNGFFWEPVPKSGEQVIHKIADSGSGISFLLDGNLKSVQVGWAYIPSSHSFECAIISGA
jgi:hypothetical protein